MSMRKYLKAKFIQDWATIPDLANVWVEATQKQIDVDSRVFAILTQATISPSAYAGLSHCDVGLTLQLVSPTKDLDAGLDELEPIIPTLIKYLRDNVAAVPAVATSFAYTETQSGYRIPLVVIANIQES